MLVESYLLAKLEINSSRNKQTRVEEMRFHKNCPKVGQGEALHGRKREMIEGVSNDGAGSPVLNDTSLQQQATIHIPIRQPTIILVLK